MLNYGFNFLIFFFLRIKDYCVGKEKLFFFWSGFIQLFISISLF